MMTRGFVVGDRILGQAADSHADWCAGYGQIGAYQFVGASAIGKLHLREPRPRDDAFAVRSAGGWLAVAVSDGAGSRKQSRYGASFAVEALCEHLLREATGVASPSEAKSTEPTSIADADDKPTQVEPILQKSEASHSKPGLLSRLVGRTPTQATPEEIEVSSPVPAFDVPSVSAPSDEVATICGTLTWHWQPPAPATTPTSPRPLPPMERSRLYKGRGVRRGRMLPLPTPPSPSTGREGVGVGRGLGG